MIGLLNKSKSSKALQIPERPRPPNLQQINEDIESAQDNDVVFSSRDGHFKDAGNENSVSMEESYLEVAPDVDGSTTSDKQDSEEKEHAYTQTVEIIEMYKKLQQAPEKMEQQLKQLQTLGSDVAQSIDELKQISDSLPKPKKREKVKK